jgi:hypothetical protein
MKKSIIPSLAIVLTTILFSCSKQAIEQPVTNVSTAKSSSWLTLNFDLITSTPTTKNIVFLQGQQAVQGFSLKSADDLVPLAFVKYRPTGNVPTSNPDSYGYSSLPVVLKTERENSDFSFEVKGGMFIVKIYNAVEANLAVDATQFQNYSFRCILVPKSTFETTKIDWSNYTSVAALLNLSL